MQWQVIFRLTGLLFERLFDRDGDSDGCADHGVVAHAEEAHHLNVRGHGGGTGKLSVGVHTAHGIGHTVGSRTGCHVVRVQSATGADAGSDGEVLLALLDAFLLVGTGDRMLETGRVGGVTGDGDINALEVHYCDALAHIVTAVAADVGTLGLGVADLTDYLQFAGSSSVPAHVEMMGFLGAGNNPMVGMTVAVAVAVEQALK